MGSIVAVVLAAACSSRAIPASDGGGDDSSDDDGPEPTPRPDSDSQPDPRPDPPQPDPSGDTTGDEPPPGAGIEHELCPELVTEAAYCLALDPIGGEFVVVGVESGSTCTLAALPNGGFIETLGWIGDDAYYCSVETGAASRLDLRTGGGEAISRDCGGLTDIDGRLIELPPLGVSSGNAFASWSDLLADAPSFSFHYDVSATRHGGGDDGLVYGAWHSTSLIERFDVAGDFGWDALPIEHDDWVNGLDRVGDDLYLTSTGARLRVFDADSGVWITDVGTGVELHGLACRPGG